MFLPQTQGLAPPPRLGNPGSATGDILQSYLTNMQLHFNININMVQDQRVVIVAYKIHLSTRFLRSLKHCALVVEKIEYCMITIEFFVDHFLFLVANTT